MLARFGVFEWSMVAAVVLGIAAGAVVVAFHLRACVPSRIDLAVRRSCGGGSTLMVGRSGCWFVSSNMCAVRSSNPSRHSHWVSDTGLHVLPQPPARCSNGAVGLPVWNFNLGKPMKAALMTLFG
jgi:hypothetical protein